MFVLHWANNHLRYFIAMFLSSQSLSESEFWTCRTFEAAGFLLFLLPGLYCYFFDYFYAGFVGVIDSYLLLFGCVAVYFLYMFWFFYWDRFEFIPISPQKAFDLSVLCCGFYFYVSYLDAYFGLGFSSLIESFGLIGTLSFNKAFYLPAGLSS